MIKTENLTKGFFRTKALDNLNWKSNKAKSMVFLDRMEEVKLLCSKS